MTWEAVTAVATTFTGLVILFSVIVGVIQLRQLRKATQLEGIMRIFDELESPQLLKAVYFVRHETLKHANDESYVERLVKGYVERDVPEFTVLRWLERLGTLAAHGLINPATFYELNNPEYIYLWIALTPIVEHMRGHEKHFRRFKAFNNAEYLKI